MPSLKKKAAKNWAGAEGKKSQQNISSTKG